jgi:hypothetical protein
LDVDGIGRGLGVDVWALRFEVVTGSAGVGNSIIIELGWGTAEYIIEVMIAISINRF